MSAAARVLPALLATALTLGACRAPARGPARSETPDPRPLAFVLEGFATPIGLPLPTVPLRLELEVDGRRVVGRFDRLVVDEWCRFGAVEGTLEGDTGDGLYRLRSEAEGGWAEFDLRIDRSRASGTATMRDARLGEPVRYGVDAARRAPMR